MALYDEYLQKLRPDETPAGASCSIDNIKEKIQPCCNIKETMQSCCKTSVGDDNSSTGGKGVSKDSVANLLLKSEEEEIDFLKKIYEPVERSRVHGFDYDEKSLKMLLLDEKSQDSFKLIGVVGVLGVGKTTLCRLIFNEEEVKQRFVPRLWIPMSEEPWEPKSGEPGSMEKVVQRMLGHLGVKEETINYISKHKLPGLLYALYLHLKGKRFLIVLDDVRDHKDNKDNIHNKAKDNKANDNKDKDKKEEESCCENLVSCLKKSKNDDKDKNKEKEKEKDKNKDKDGDKEKEKEEDKNKDKDEDKDKEKKEKPKQSYYEDLVSCLENGHGFPKGDGGAVIVTSRNEEAIKKIVGEQNLHRLLPLSDPESCWAIYKDFDASKEGTQESNDVPKEVKEELKKRCGGFPLVARMMKEIKQRKDKNEQSTTSKDGSDEVTEATNNSSSNEPSTTKEGGSMPTN